MNCPTPNITVPQEMLKGDGNRRRKRYLHDHAETRDVISTENSEFSQLHHHGHRVRRATDEEGEPLNSDALQFYLGFILDGVTIYRDLRDVLPDSAVLRVYLNPEIQHFNHDREIMLYRPYWWFSDDFINIRVSCSVISYDNFFIFYFCIQVYKKLYSI